ncbi:permease-like cell division protein FtsX [Nonomuraea jabiensis]|uniref:Cell division protein FtsX n=1 Tax=Nonomuraea jabiensis TaxID=882448 RepID=A0A7W9G1W2_9ACTN|nr:permease-like cell division protein FtsX [Nonomuraea jabiensis]MBB5775730.1 cell division protein FtsX [Nonomuraea jabiensis]
MDAGTLRPLRAPERRRFRVDFRLVAVAATVVLAGAATTVGLLGGPGDENRAVAADPPPAERKVTVFLCAKSSDRKQTACKGAVSEEETQEIVAKVRQVPGLKEMSYADKSAVYADFRRNFAHNEPLLAAVGVDDIPDSLRLTLMEGTDPRSVQEALRGLPGILDVREVVPDDATPPSKWDLSVFLCSPSSGMPSCGAERKPDGKGSFTVTKEGTGVTLAQKKAIQKLIVSTPGVKEVFFEDQTTAYENFRRLYKDNKVMLNATKVTDMPQSFRVMLLPEADWSKLVSRLGREPGVSQALYHGCLYDSARLMNRYGLFLPESKVCPPDRRSGEHPDPGPSPTAG